MTDNHKFRTTPNRLLMLNNYSEQAENEQNWNKPQRRSGFFVPGVISLAAVLAWLIYILLFALYWSKGYDLFQDVVVFIVTLCITALLIGLMWMIWGRYKHFWNF